MKYKVSKCCEEGIVRESVRQEEECGKFCNQNEIFLLRFVNVAGVL